MKTRSDHRRSHCRQFEIIWGLYSYSHDETTQLTAAIVARENIAPEQIVLGETLDVLGLYLAARGGPGSEFIYSEPGYTALVDAVAPAGGLVVGVPLDARLENDLDAIASRVGPRTQAVYLVNPHNPSGTVSAPIHRFRAESVKA